MFQYPTDSLNLLEQKFIQLFRFFYLALQRFPRSTEYLQRFGALLWSVNSQCKIRIVLKAYGASQYIIILVLIQVESSSENMAYCLII